MERCIQVRNEAIRRTHNFVVDHLSTEQIVDLDGVLSQLVDPFPNNPDRYKGLGGKRLGIIRATPYAWDGEHLVDLDSGFALVPDQLVMEIHLTIPDPENKSFANITQSFRKLAQFMIKQGFLPNYIVGFTYEKLATAAKRAGFKKSTIRVPEDKRALIEKFYGVFRRRGYVNGDMGEVYTIFQSRDDFMRRYGPKVQPNEVVSNLPIVITPILSSQEELSK